MKRLLQLALQADVAAGVLGLAFAVVMMSGCLGAGRHAAAVPPAPAVTIPDKCAHCPAGWVLKGSKATCVKLKVECIEAPKAK